MTNRFFEISSPRDMLGKAKRDFAVMMSQLSVDSIFNFFVTAYHVMDYVKTQGKASDEAINKFYEDEDFKMCNYICNKGKHPKKRSTLFETRHNKAALFDSACFDEVAFDQPESYVLIASGRRINVIPLAQRILDKWENFFKDNGI